MTAVFVFRPRSRESKWLLSLTINSKVRRIINAMNKLNNTYHVARCGRYDTILMLYDWCNSMHQLETYFDKEIARLTKIIKRNYKDKLLLESEVGCSYRIKVSSPPAAIFYRLLSKHDTLMSVVEACIALNLFKNRQTRSKKGQKYSKEILTLINNIGKYKISSALAEHPTLTQAERNTLGYALQSEVMPTFRKDIFDALILLTNHAKEKIT